MTRGLYIHFPFCKHICNYCDFYVLDTIEKTNSYIESLLIEFDLFFKNHPHFIKSKINTIYFGGGTPSLMSPNHLNQIIAKIKEYLLLDDELEISMEANPSSLNKENITAYKEIGSNRLSIGVQSFVKKELGKLTRDHSPKKAIDSVNTAFESGINNISVDLIFSIPDQTPGSYEESLAIASSLPISHISTYSLIYEPGTKLYKKWKEGKFKKLSDDEDADLYERSIDLLSKKGFEQYEVSNFARNSKYCKHNLQAWQRGEYFAFGVSSHGHLDSIRFSNHRDIIKYSKDIDQGNLPVFSKEILTDREKIEESIFLGLRATGFNLETTLSNSNNPNELMKRINELMSEGYLIINDNNVSLTKRGYMICDNLSFQIINLL